MSYLVRYVFLLTLILSTLLSLSGSGTALAQGDGDDPDVEDMEIEDEDDMEVEDEEEEEPVTVPDSIDESDTDSDLLDEEDDEDEEKKLGPHPDASTTLIFTNKQNNEFTAGEVVHTLIGFTNDAEFDFIVTGIEASFRYPQDFSYYIQNFTMVPYETYVKPQTQMSFTYSFVPSESFYARPFGLTVNIHYSNAEEDPELFVDAVFNDTINIVEVEEGLLDGETFFMYVFMVSGISLLMFIIHYVYTTTVRKSSSSSKKPLETGTQNKDDIDYQWLPPGTIPGTPKKSPRASASPRRTKK